MKQPIQVYICHTVFHLLVSLMKAMTQAEKDHYILVPDFLKFKPRVFVGTYITAVVVYPYSIIEQDWVAYKSAKPLALFSYPAAIQKIVDVHFKWDIATEVLQDADFNVYNDGSPFVNALMLKYRKNHFTLIEDGEAIYTVIKKDFKFFTKIFTRYPLYFGNSSIINRVEVRFPERLSPRVKRKAYPLPFEEMKAFLSKEMKNDLLNFFNVEDVPNGGEAKSFLLLTQPLSEDGIVDEEYKIQLYTKILEQYGANCRIFIKPHPRELTDYSLTTIKATMIGKESPVELLEFASCKFDKAVTLFSTAIHSVPADERIFLSLDYDKIVKKAWFDYMGVNKVHN